MNSDHPTCHFEVGFLIAKSLWHTLSISHRQCKNSVHKKCKHQQKLFFSSGYHSNKILIIHPVCKLVLDSISSRYNDNELNTPISTTAPIDG
jgi:hypothetical protein